MAIPGLGEMWYDMGGMSERCGGIDNEMVMASYGSHEGER